MTPCRTCPPQLADEQRRSHAPRLGQEHPARTRSGQSAALYCSMSARYDAINTRRTSKRVGRFESELNGKVPHNVATVVLAANLRGPLLNALEVCENDEIACELVFKSAFKISYVCKKNQWMPMFVCTNVGMYATTPVGLHDDHYRLYKCDVMSGVHAQR